MGVASGWSTHGTVRACERCVCGCMCLCGGAECGDGGACDVCVEAEVLVCVRAESDSGTQCSVVGALDSSDVGCVLVVSLVQLHDIPVALACCCRHAMSVLVCVCGGAVQVCCAQPRQPFPVQVCCAQPRQPFPVQQCAVALVVASSGECRATSLPVCVRALCPALLSG
jgi:hypothetical protein